MNDFIAFIDYWQTLVGSALGPFLAVILSGIGLWFKSRADRKKERREFLRRIEIGITRSLDDTFKTREKLRYFVGRLRNLITQIRSIENSRHFSLETINYPTIRDIYRDIEMPNFKVRSYYLHNKLLWADAGIKETNETVITLKNDFIELQRKNELNVMLMRQNPSPNPASQRADYADNLESFANAIDEFTNKFIKQGVEIMVQIKVFNDNLRKRHGFWFWWKCEGTKFKYFKNKKEQKQFARNLDSLEKIDQIIKKEVDAELTAIEEKIVSLSQHY